MILDMSEPLPDLEGSMHDLIHCALPLQMNPYSCKSNMEYYYHQQDEMAQDGFQVRSF